MALRVTVWNEYRHERTEADVAAVYPDGIHATLAEAFRERDFEVETATLDEPEHGLTEAVLAETDVLTWWGHDAHEEVEDAIVERVHRRVLDGMGLLVLHSGHHSKVFKRLMGTSCDLKWRESGETERLWVLEPGHPIVAGVDEQVVIPSAEMYGEPFDVPTPETTVFCSWFEGGEVFRSGCCYRRGKGKVFYFRPGHETYPVYEQPAVRQILCNAAEWASPVDGPAVSHGHAVDEPTASPSTTENY